MTFEPGNNANPNGRPKGRKIITDCINVELNSAADDGDGKKVRALARRLVDSAIEGNMTAASIVLERVEGKAGQTLDINHEVRLETDFDRARYLAFAAEIAKRFASDEAKTIEGEVDKPGIEHKPSIPLDIPIKKTEQET